MTQIFGYFFLITSKLRFWYVNVLLKKMKKLLFMIKLVWVNHHDQI